MSESPRCRRASARDAYPIADLYRRVYSGTYSDPMMSHPELLVESLAKSEYHWIVAESAGDIVGSVVYRYDPINALAKVYGGVVDPACRGHNLTEEMMKFGYRGLSETDPPVEVVYATTRTVSPAPQKLTANLGYKKLGIFPNVHKTAGYETHCLTALFSENAMRSRFADFALHPKVVPLFELARKECGLPALPSVSQEHVDRLRVTSNSEGRSPLILEFVQAPYFVKHRFEEQKRSSRGHHWFYPFHEPNLMLTNADQSAEVFCYFSQADKHCVLIGIGDKKGEGIYRILSTATEVLHDLGARYMECIIRADEVEKTEMALQAEFIPCAYFPSMHGSGKLRHDFVVFSRSFEILNFRNLKLEGVNRQYLLQYFNTWKEISLSAISDSSGTEG
jgi:RimJ/RimL family protein N-acetyltransferase